MWPLFNLATFMPVIFIITFGIEIGMSFTDTVLGLSIHNMARMIGTYLSGTLVKNQARLDLLVASFAFSTAFIHLIVWGLCKTKVLLFIYAILIGFSTGGEYYPS